MKRIDLKAGDLVQTDTGFTCMPAGKHVVHENCYGLFIHCTHGNHYLVGQVDGESDELVGISYPPM